MHGTTPASCRFKQLLFIVLFPIHSHWIGCMYNVNCNVHNKLWSEILTLVKKGQNFKNLDEKLSITG